MNNLYKYLKVIKDSIKTIEKSLIVKGKLSYTIQYFPLTEEKHQLLVAIFITRVKDDVTLTEYNLVIVTDENETFHFEGITRETIDITNHQRMFERFEKDEIAFPDLITNFDPLTMTQDKIVVDFVENFNRLTDGIYNLKAFHEDAIPGHYILPRSNQQQWKSDLGFYLKSKGKHRDMVNFITHLNIKLIAILQDIGDHFETYDGFTMEIRRKRFNETLTFPLVASSILLSSDGRPVLEYNFSWTRFDNQDIHLEVIITRYCQDKIECEEQPSWLIDCEYGSPYAMDLGIVDDLHDHALKWFIINMFEKMTRNFQI